MDLVLLKGLVAMGLSLVIKGNGQVIRALLSPDLEEHLGEAEDGIGGLALGVGKVGYGMEGTIEVRVAVDEVKGRSGRGGGHLSWTLRRLLIVALLFLRQW
jgi:hypothetical protein